MLSNQSERNFSFPLELFIGNKRRWPRSNQYLFIAANYTYGIELNTSEIESGDLNSLIKNENVYNMVEWRMAYKRTFFALKYFSRSETVKTMNGKQWQVNDKCEWGNDTERLRFHECPFGMSRTERKWITHIIYTYTYCGLTFNIASHDTSCVHPLSYNIMNINHCMLWNKSKRTIENYLADLIFFI